MRKRTIYTYAILLFRARKEPLTEAEYKYSKDLFKMAPCRPHQDIRRKIAQEKQAETEEKKLVWTVGESKLNTNKTALVALVFIAVLLFSHFALRSGDPIHLVKALEVPVFEHAIVNGADYATCVCVGDVDGDGFSDVIVAKNGVGLSWYRYPNWDNYSIGLFDWRSEDMPCADIDGDGDLDVVGADSNNKIYWYENPRPNGDPTNVWVSHYIGSCSYYVWGGLGVADFNNDGKLDVVVRADAYGGAGEISFFVQNISSWSAVKTMHTRSHDGLDVGDLDGDSDMDIVLNGFWLENPYPDLSGNWSEHNIDSKWWNQSTHDENSWADNNARTVVVDLNKDGRLDVLFSQSEGPGYPLSWYETSNPRSGPWIEHVIGYVDCCHTLLVGDLNLDGYLDVVAASFENNGGLFPPPFPIKVYYNSGNSLSWNEVVVSDLGIYKGVLGDIANDGDLDIVGSHGYLKPPVEIWVNSPNPTSTPTPTPSPTATPTPTPTPTGTSVFSSGFEDGFNSWTSTYGGVSVVTSPTYSGNYAMKCSNSWGSQATKSIATQSKTYTEAEFSFDKNFAGTQTLIAYFNGNSNPTVSMGLSVQSGSAFFFVEDKLPSYSYSQYRLTGITAGTWYKLALDASATSAAIYINDLKLTAVSQANIPATTSVKVGMFWGDSSYTGNLYIDNVQISTSSGGNLNPTPTPSPTPIPTPTSTPTPNPTGTPIFSSGFEDGFNSWTTTSGGVSAVSSLTYSGNYAMKCSDPSASKATKTIGSQSKTYTEAEFYFDRNIAGSETLIVYFNANGNPIVAMGLSVQSGNVFAFVEDKLPSYQYSQYELTGITPGTWYKFALDASASSATIYLNNQKLTSISQTNIPATASVGVGMFWGNGVYTGNLYIDNVQISTSSGGNPNSTPTPTPTPTGTSVFSSGFEDGFSRWTSTYGGVSAVSSPVYSGNYAMKCSESWGSQATKSIGSQSETYTEAEFCFDQNFAGSQSLIAYFDGNGHATVSMGISVQSGSVFAFVQTILPSYSYSQYKLTSLSPGTWYKFALDASATSATIFLNDQQLAATSLANIPATASVSVGMFWGNGVYTGNLYIDNVQIDT